MTHLVSLYGIFTGGGKNYLSEMLSSFEYPLVYVS